MTNELARTSRTPEMSQNKHHGLTDSETIEREA
jgi:hypothetical protein